MTSNLLVRFIQDVNLDAPETANQVSDNGFHVPSILIILIIMAILLVLMRIRRNRQE